MVQQPAFYASRQKITIRHATEIGLGYATRMWWPSNAGSKIAVRLEEEKFVMRRREGHDNHHAFHCSALPARHVSMHLLEKKRGQSPTATLAGIKSECNRH